MSSWREYPSVEVTSPILALAGYRQVLWAGGAGGVARYEGNWQPRNAGLALTSVSSLCGAGEWLIAGGIDGIARYLITMPFDMPGNGAPWQPAQIQGKIQPVTTILASPRFSSEPVLLAGTLGSGVLISSDGGSSWRPTNFGLQNGEVNALAWRKDGTILAATTAGICLSTNEGQAWRAARGTEGLSLSCVAFLKGGTALAAREEGGLLRSDDSGANWEPFPADLPEDVQILSLQAASDGTLFLGTAEQGTLRSTDGGATWETVLDQTAITLAEVEGTLYAGLADGRIIALHPEKKDALQPPLNDLSLLLVNKQRPMAVGLQSGLWIWSSRQGWKTPGDLPDLLTALEIAPDGGLVLASPDGIYRSDNQGKKWEAVYTNEAIVPTRLTFRTNGWGWAGTASSQVLRTKNNGRTWELLDAPIGGGSAGAPPLVALQASPDLVMAATYDSRFYIAQLWYSQDAGQSWLRGASVRTDWPVIATSSQPPVFSLGGVLVILKPNNTWVRQNTLNRGGVLRLAGNNQVLYVLAQGGLLSSVDHGETWTDEPDCPPVSQILDITVDKDTLYLLLAGGKVISRPVGK